MKFSALAGTAIVPLLARLVLCAAFLPAGFQKVFETTKFEGEDAQILNRLGVGGGPVPAPSAAPQEPAAADPAQPADSTSESPVELPAESPAESTPQSIAPVETRSLHTVSALLVKNGWPLQWMPQYMAWAAALTELLGGVLLLFGLFSRLWGLGLATAMGFAFYLTSWPALDMTRFLAIVDDIEAFNRLFCQLGLLVLALGVFLTGPGPLSLDRMLFKRSGRKDDHDGDAM